MALDFPANPTDGQVFGTYIWSASKGVWQAKPSSATVAVPSQTPPSSANNGDIWIDTSDGVAYFYYSDGTSSQWVELMSSGVPTMASKADKTYVDSQDALKANLAGGNSFTGVQTLATPLSVTSGGTGSSTVASAQTNLQIPLSGNFIINGAMNFWQRGTSFSNIGASTYTADRWRTTTGGLNATVTRDGGPPSARFSTPLRMAPASNGTPSEFAMRQVLEIQDSMPLVGNNVTASFWIYSTKTTCKVRMFTFNSSGSFDTTETFSVTANTWTYVQKTFTGFTGVTGWTAGANASGAALDIGWQNNIAVTTSDAFYLTGVQLEIGSAATAFKNNGNTFNDELATCQRYYHNVARYGNAGYDNDYGVNQMTVTYPVPMRVSPSVTITGGGMEGHHGTAPGTGTGNEYGFCAVWTGGAVRDFGARASISYYASAEL